MTDEVRFYIRDIRAAKLCSRGARGWFKTHELDWDLFLKEGLPVTILEEMNDAHAHKVAEVARGRQQ